ncbi:alpha/beta fold hydrolase [Nocardioides sp. DS6]|uniref:Alpha/beta fold hydrolase n=1 Tax=Nocardioides eburneus TaxID=3231482 RepID=A0ABV3SZ07_9ACTN
MTRLELPTGLGLEVDDLGQGRTLLFHPGFSQTREAWHPLTARLLDDYRCVVFDPRGHGRSDKPLTSYSLAEMAGDVADLIDALDLNDVTLVAHSLGAAVALTLVLKQPSTVSRLVLLGPVAPARGRRTDVEAGQNFPVERETERLTSTWVDRQLENQSPGRFYARASAETARWLAWKSLEMPVHVAARYYAQPRIDFRDQLADLTLPCLVGWGSLDQVCDPSWASWFADNLGANWRVREFPGCGHGLMVDAPDLIADAIREFVPR